jgi:hypothetical protein
MHTLNKKLLLNVAGRGKNDNNKHESLISSSCVSVYDAVTMISPILHRGQRKQGIAWSHTVGKWWSVSPGSSAYNPDATHTTLPCKAEVVELTPMPLVARALLFKQMH